MEKEELTVENIITMLLDVERRKKLIQALEAEQGSILPLTNWYSQLASCCQASEEELRQVAHILLAENDEHLLGDLLFHPNMPSDVLFHLVDLGYYITQLGHRSGPQELLERLASEYGYSEAITTLALYYYNQPNIPPSQFREFLEKYKNDVMLEFNLRRTKNLSEEKKQVVVEIFEDEAYGS